MSKLESVAKPILTQLANAGQIALLPEDQLVLARWIFLKMQIGEQEMPEDAVTPPDVRKSFKENLELPNGLRIWIADCQSDDWKAQYVRVPQRIIHYTGSPPPDAYASHPNNTHTVSFGFERLFVCAYYSTNADGHLNMADPGTIKQLWPIRGIIIWPPEKSISAENADRVAKALLYTRDMPQRN